MIYFTLYSIGQTIKIVDFYTLYTYQYMPSTNIPLMFVNFMNNSLCIGLCFYYYYFFKLALYNVSPIGNSIPLFTLEVFSDLVCDIHSVALETSISSLDFCAFSFRSYIMHHMSYLFNICPHFSGVP